MPTATPPTLSEDQVDDLLYLARTGETSDLKAGIDLIAKDLSATPSTILTAAVDSHSGNGLLHMASANGHTGTKFNFSLPSFIQLTGTDDHPVTLTTLLTLSHPTLALSLNLQNSSGNTALHWAALNGHLEAVKVLVEAGADVTVCNKAGHDAIFEAEANEKTEVVEWLLASRKEVERGFVGARNEEDQEVDVGEVIAEEEGEGRRKEGG